MTSKRPTFKYSSLSSLVLVAALSGLTSGCAQMMASLSGPGITDEDPGRRTVGMVVEDSSLQTKILGNLYKLDTRFQDAGIDVESFNGVVLLAGHVSDERMVATADKVARAMRNVRKVHNELRVGPSASTATRTHDAWIASKVRFVMNVTRDFPASRIHVTVNEGTVYLMGLVTEREASETISIIGDVAGIKRIVKAFEYIAERPSARAQGPMDTIPGQATDGYSPPPAGAAFPAASEAVEQDENFHTSPIE
jgi:osmotically-inducible protein OsmY